MSKTHTQIRFIPWHPFGISLSIITTTNKENFYFLKKEEEGFKAKTCSYVFHDTLTNHKNNVIYINVCYIDHYQSVTIDAIEQVLDICKTYILHFLVWTGLKKLVQ